MNIVNQTGTRIVQNGEDWKRLWRMMIRNLCVFIARSYSFNSDRQEKEWYFWKDRSTRELRTDDFIHNITIFSAQCADIGSEFVPHMGKCQIFNCGSTTAGLSPWPLFSLTISLTPLHERFYCLSWLKFELTFAGRNCFQKLLWDTFTDDETFMRATRYDNSSRFLKVIDKLTIWAAHLYGFTMASDGESDDDTQRHKNSKTKKP